MADKEKQKNGYVWVLSIPSKRLWLLSEQQKLRNARGAKIARERIVHYEQTAVVNFAFQLFDFVIVCCTFIPMQLTVYHYVKITCLAFKDNLAYSRRFYL